jgi:hypothetical protein
MVTALWVINAAANRRTLAIASNAQNISIIINSLAKGLQHRGGFKPPQGYGAHRLRATSPTLSIPHYAVGGI